MRFRTVLLILALTAPCVAMAAGQQAYRWTDAKGVVHFSDSRPAKGVKYDVVNMKTATTTRTPTADERGAGSASDNESSADSSSAEQASTEGQTAKDTPANRAKLCATLADNIELLQGNQPVISGGKVLDDEQRAQQLTLAQQQQQQFCSNDQALGS